MVGRSISGAPHLAVKFTDTTPRLTVSSSPDFPALNSIDKYIPEGSPEQTVDDKVTRRVEDHKNVTQLSVVEVKVATLASVVAERSPKYLVEQRRGLTDEKDTDDGDDAVGDVVLLAATTRVEGLEFEDVEGDYQLEVEIG